MIDHEIEPGLRDRLQQPGKFLQRVVAAVEHHRVVLDEVVGRRVVPLVHEHLEHLVRCLAIVQLEVVARLEVDGKRGLREGLQVDGEDLEADVVVVQLVVAHRDVHVQREVFPVLEEQAFVDVRGLLKVAPQVVDRRQGQLIALVVVVDAVVVLHQLLLVVEAVRQVEEKAIPQQAVRPFERRFLGALEHLHVKQAAGLVEVSPLRVLARAGGNQLLVAAESPVKVRQVKSAVARPHEILRLLPGAGLNVEVHQGQGAREVTRLDVLLERRHRRPKSSRGAARCGLLALQTTRRRQHSANQLHPQGLPQASAICLNAP
eukprot:scaffold1638_cov258-Pinguiococcus_pyrenoidosus.AAC.33